MYFFVVFPFKRNIRYTLHTLAPSRTRWLARLWRKAGVGNRKLNGWRKWRSPPSSLSLTLLINITKAYLRSAQHKITSCPAFIQDSTCELLNIASFSILFRTTTTDSVCCAQGEVFLPTSTLGGGWRACLRYSVPGVWSPVPSLSTSKEAAAQYSDERRFPSLMDGNRRAVKFGSVGPTPSSRWRLAGKFCLFPSCLFSSARTCTDDAFSPDINCVSNSDFHHE